MTSVPRFVALCGWPKSGKDEAANALFLTHRYHCIDDGLCLRKAAPHLFGCDESDPFSQDGKVKEYDTIKGKQTVRWMLGELGRALENHFGEHFMPHRAIAHANEFRPDGGGRFVFPSVRGSQGEFYKERGARVIQISRPGAGDSGYDFDRWDERLVDVIIHNDWDLLSLRKAMVQAVEAPLSDEGPIEIRASNFAETPD